MWQSIIGDPLTLAITVLCSFILSFLVSYSEILLTQKQKQIKKLERELEKIFDTEQWEIKAREIDELSGANVWKEIRESDHYDYESVENRTMEIKALIREKNYTDLVYLLRGGLEREFGGILNPNLYKVSLVGTKVIIEDYINEVERALLFLYNAPDSEFPLQDKFSFFMETRQTFGRTAFMMSGGAAFGMFHIGVARATTLRGHVPRIISGSSAGSIIAAGLASTPGSEMHKFDEPANYSLKAFAKGVPNEFWENVHRFATSGSFMDVEHLVKCMKDNLDDLTFKEVYEKTGRILNITLGTAAKNQKPRLLNYLTAPDVVIWPAVAASCAFPGLFEAIPLIQRRKNGEHVPFIEPTIKWRDGSLEHDLPRDRLSQMFNVNFHVVSQVNPHVIPIFHLCRSRPIRMLLRLIGSEVQHRINQLGHMGLIPSIIHSIAMQDYTGDVTICPTPAWWQWFYVLSNPSDVMMREAMLRGRHAFLKKRAHYEVGVRIEIALEDRIGDLCHRMNVPYLRDAPKKVSEPSMKSSKALAKQTSSISLEGMATLHLSSVHLPRLASQSEHDSN